MEWEPDRPKPTIADEASPVVDDRVVIEKTLPNVAPAAPSLEIGYVEKFLTSTRSYVSDNPVRAALMAVGGGALLAQLLILSLRRRPHLPG